MHVDLRTAKTFEEKAAAYRLRYDFYVEGRGFEMDEADHDRRWLIDEHDAVSSIFIAEVDGQVVGTVQLTWGGTARLSDSLRQSYDITRFEGVVDERDVIISSRLFVRPEYRGSPISRYLLQKVFEFAAEHNAELIFGRCETHLASYYHQFGFRTFGELYNHPIFGVPVTRVVVVTGDLEYLRQTDATALGILNRRTRPPARLGQILELVSERTSIMSQEQESPRRYWSEVTRPLEDANGGLCGFMGSLTRDEAIKLLAKSHILSCGPKAALCLKGHVARTPYILLSGSLEVHDEGEILARIEQRGAMVGEAAMLTSGPRLRDLVVGAQGARVIALHYGNLREIIAGDQSLAAKVLDISQKYAP